MKRLKTLTSALAVGALTLALAACGGESAGGSDTSTSTTGTTYKIGVLQLTEHAALDASNEGFVAALDDAGIDYEIDQQNAQKATTSSSPLVRLRHRRSPAPRATSPSSAPPSPTSPSLAWWRITRSPAATSPDHPTSPQ